MGHDVETVNVPNIWHEVAVGLWFPAKVKAVGPAMGLTSANVPPGASGAAFSLEATFHMKRDGLGYLLGALELQAAYAADEIDGGTLRKLSLVGIKGGIGERVGRLTHELPADIWGIEPLNISSEVREQAGEDRLVRVARIYAREVLSGRRPAKAVSEELEIPSSTAGYWIRRAKDLQYLRNEQGDFSRGYEGNAGLSLTQLQEGDGLSPALRAVIAEGSPARMKQAHQHESSAP